RRSTRRTDGRATSAPLSTSPLLRAWWRGSWSRAAFTWAACSAACARRRKLLGMKCVLVAALLACAALGPAARAEPRPKWEAGGGATGLRLPDYRGSGGARGDAVPLPHLVHRGPAQRLHPARPRAGPHEADRGRGPPRGGR